MSPTLTTFVFELVNFLLLAGALGWLLFKPVRATLQAREAAMKAQSADLAARQADAERVRAALAAERASFEAEMVQARSTRVAAAAEEAAAIVARAREAANREHDNVLKNLADVDRAELNKLARAIAAAAGGTVAHLLATLGAVNLEADLIRAASEALRTLDAPSVGAVVVESTKALAAHDREVLAAAIGTRATSTSFEVLPDLGTGVRVTTGAGRIEATVEGLVREAERQIAKALTVEGFAPRP